MARAREHLLAAEEGHAERGLEEVRPERLDPDRSRVQASRRAVRAAALRLDGACLSVCRHARANLDALKQGPRAVGLLCSSNAHSRKGDRKRMVAPSQIAEDARPPSYERKNKRASPFVPY